MMTAYDEVRATLAELKAQDQALGVVAGVYGSATKVPDHADALRAETVLDLRDCLQAAEQRAYALGHPHDWSERRYLVGWRRALAMALPVIAMFAEQVARDEPADFENAHVVVASLVSFDVDATRSSAKPLASG